ncbi:hypothetical protein [Paenibacillus ginsengarvi]|nr:hypothetical protein [Paenibacillus ginsengarvi]
MKTEIHQAFPLFFYQDYSDYIKVATKKVEEKLGKWLFCSRILFIRATVEYGLKFHINEGIGNLKQPLLCYNELSSDNGGIMMISKKMDPQAASAIKSILQKLNINNPRVFIDLEKQTVEAQEDDYSVDDLLEAAGTLTPERGKELLEEVNKSRREWNA